MMIAGVQPLWAQSCIVENKNYYQYQDIRQILDKNKCNSCHNTDNNKLWQYHDYETMIGWLSCKSKVIVPGRPDQSVLVEKINGGPVKCGAPMPLEGEKVSRADLIAIETWISEGAPEFCIAEYDEIRAMLLSNNCASCHQQPSNWSFGSYSDIFKSASNSLCDGDIIVRNNAQASLLYQKIKGTASCGGAMPPSGPPLSYEQVAKIRDWINAGAPESTKILPVTLTDFFVSVYDKDKINVIWKTSAEIQTSHFEVETSRDGIHFFSIGRIDAEGGNTFGQQYRFTYDAPQIGYHYFRLRIYDYDGSFVYSSIRVARVENSEEYFQIFPVPAIRGDRCTVVWYASDDREKVKMSLVSITGDLYREYVIHTGFNELDLMDILPGTYYITVEDYYTHVKIQKFIVLDP
ncbi:MAG: T9SS type A sorting domain-containing protein [Saprospiraceae bacterium]|nr:MAG: peptidase S8 and S53 subtilisin kexin sedolisin [Bacteroidetes bacterium OLB9]MCO6464100.1 T9SS type A sorting domain-containing protein [Saprospiraceae bacterium]